MSRSVSLPKRENENIKYFIPLVGIDSHKRRDYSRTLVLLRYEGLIELYNLHLFYYYN